LSTCLIEISLQIIIKKAWNFFIFQNKLVSWCIITISMIDISNYLHSIKARQVCVSKNSTRKRVNITRLRVKFTRMRVLFKYIFPKILSICRTHAWVSFQHIECDLYTQSVILTHVWVWFEKQEHDNNMQSVPSYTQSVIFTCKYWYWHVQLWFWPAACDFHTYARHTNSIMLKYTKILGEASTNRL
jgi:hypothetical protein